MTLYMLEWFNGMQFDDAQEILLGIYQSREEREEAEARYRASDVESFPFCGRLEDGNFMKWEVEMGKDLLLVKLDE